ncbi:carbohydrate kinase family protein [bacterium]|nr:carbohydrate kinase family protein [bacterium]
MKKITTIGAALVDIFLDSPSFSPQDTVDGRFLCQPYGHKIEIADHFVTSGGAATNVAVALARRGHDVSIVAELGRDHFATFVKNELIRERVDTHYLIQEKSEKTGCSVILRGPGGERTVMVSRSASAMLDDYDIPLKYLRSRDWIHLSSVGGNLNALGEIWKVFDNSDMNFSWNPGRRELELLVTGELPIPATSGSMFFVNSDEWALIPSIQNRILTSFKYVVVTAGEVGGVIYVDGQKFADYNAISQGQAVEATGAGDAFAAGFVSTILYERPVEEAIMAAVNNADSVIRYVGAKQGLLSF